MKKLPILFLFFFAACMNNPQEKNIDNSSTSLESFQGISIDLSENPEMDFKKLRIYPVIADQSFINEHAFAANFKNLKEAMEIKGFRITENKPFGRFNDGSAVNTLTVQNKSEDTIYIMSGDVVQGGKQDRILAQDMVIPPRKITSIPVFCVEPHRWEYRDSSQFEGHQDLAINNDHQAEQNRKIYAFTDYYNVASNDLRKTMKHTKNQSAVWDKVGELTSINNAESATGAYANLENSEDFTKVRNEYQTFFSDKMEYVEGVVGMLVVSGNKILGTDIFSHPALFKKQYEVLLHAYITEAISNGADTNITDSVLDRYVKQLKYDFSHDLGGEREKEVKFRYNGKLVHFADL